MKPLHEEIFVCLDCETTGLNPQEDAIIEVALIEFQGKQHRKIFETLIDPQKPIPPETINIHHITNDMVENKPLIQEVLPTILELIGSKIIVGHGIMFDISILAAACQQHHITHALNKHHHIDTLRLARLYGQSPTNSLEALRQHFNIKAEGAHRALNDVIVNIEVFYHLSQSFKTLGHLEKRLENPIEMKHMPLGKHKGRALKEVPLSYLKWASHQNFDRDLSFSIQKELKRRARGANFDSSPFAQLPL